MDKNKLDYIYELLGRANKLLDEAYIAHLSTVKDNTED